MTSPVTSVTEAVEAIRRGDSAQYACIVRLYEKRLFSLLLMFLRDRAAAEDVMQEAFVRAYAQLERFDTSREFYPWLATIAVRFAQNWKRSRTRMVDDTSDIVGRTQAQEDVVNDAIADEQAQLLWETVEALPQGERTAVLLFYQQDMSVTDVAAILGVTAGTVKTVLFRAREKLRVSLASMNKEHLRDL